MVENRRLSVMCGPSTAAESGGTYTAARTILLTGGTGNTGTSAGVPCRIAVVPAERRVRDVERERDRPDARVLGPVDPVHAGRDLYALDRDPLGRDQAPGLYPG